MKAFRRTSVLVTSVSLSLLMALAGYAQTGSETTSLTAQLTPEASPEPEQSSPSDQVSSPAPGTPDGTASPSPVIQPFSIQDDKLKNLIEKKPATADSAKKKSNQSSKPSNKALVLGGIGAVTLIALAIALYLLWRSPKSQSAKPAPSPNLSPKAGTAASTPPPQSNPSNSVAVPPQTVATQPEPHPELSAFSTPKTPQAAVPQTPQPTATPTRLQMEDSEPDSESRSSSSIAAYKTVVHAYDTILQIERAHETEIPLEETSRMVSTDIVESLISDLQTIDSAKRSKVIWELSQLGDSRAIQPLVDLLIDADSKQTSLILAALSEISMRSLKPMKKALAVSLQNENPEVRKNAIRDLTRVYDAIGQISQLLLHAVEDSDPEVQDTARWALGQFNRLRGNSPQDLPGFPGSTNSSR